MLVLLGCVCVCFSLGGCCCCCMIFDDYDDDEEKLMKNLRHFVFKVYNNFFFITIRNLVFLVKDKKKFFLNLKKVYARVHVFLSLSSYISENLVFFLFEKL